MNVESIQEILRILYQCRQSGILVPNGSKAQELRSTVLGVVRQSMGKAEVVQKREIYDFKSCNNKKKEKGSEFECKQENRSYRKFHYSTRRKTFSSIPLQLTQSEGVYKLVLRNDISRRICWFSMMFVNSKLKTIAQALKLY